MTAGVWVSVHKIAHRLQGVGALLASKAPPTATYKSGALIYVDGADLQQIHNRRASSARGSG